MTLSDAILVYLATGCAMSAFALVRMLRHPPSVDHLRRTAGMSGMPVWFAALLVSVALLFVLVEYAVLWPIRWREALR